MQPTVLFRPGMKHRPIRPEELTPHRRPLSGPRRGPGPPGVVARRSFRWRGGSRYISLRDDDQAEVALVKDPMELPPSSRQALVEALAEAGFVFEVSRVIEVEEEVEIRHWRVETKQGARSFQTRLDDWPRALPGGGFLLRDVAGDLYRLP